MWRIQLNGTKHKWDVLNFLKTWNSAVIPPAINKSIFILKPIGMSLAVQKTGLVNPRVVTVPQAPAGPVDP